MIFSPSRVGKNQIWEASYTRIEENHYLVVVVLWSVGHPFKHVFLDLRVMSVGDDLHVDRRKSPSPYIRKSDPLSVYKNVRSDLVQSFSDQKALANCLSKNSQERPSFVLNPESVLKSNEMNFDIQSNPKPFMSCF